MPEGLEAEIYRRSALVAVGRQVESVLVDPAQPQAEEIAASLPGEVLGGVERVGKHVVLEFESSSDPDHGDGLRLGVHFGMSGRLIVDDRAAIGELVYASNRLDPSWDRLVIEFTAASGGGSIRVNDPRRWSKFVLDPGQLPVGVDLLDVTPAELGRRLADRTASIKSVLLNQDVVAGLGNMLVDEVLSGAGIHPGRPARDLDEADIERLVATLDERLPTMLAAGGSHAGLLDPAHRASLGACPRCGGGLERSTVAGRTTVWCPDHQT